MISSDAASKARVGRYWLKMENAIMYVPELPLVPRLPPESTSHHPTQLYPGKQGGAEELDATSSARTMQRLLLTAPLAV
ncbi:hypothetical protein A176_004904 [Myxococcus hansupus]|uniref:Uncharacterized protein n=1 Tax=Pseudomyxococcus hansupus TaxID=1297742 RepID=A0A0H4XID9_9BACT|nr:hypothetical protein A176_004904 [Myxococcus hansupus]